MVLGCLDLCFYTAARFGIENTGPRHGSILSSATAARLEGLNLAACDVLQAPSSKKRHTWRQ
jgi:hypothetical protein